MLLPDLPEEVAQGILRAFVDPLDLVRLAQTCHVLAASIDDELLWRYHYLRHYDAPHEDPPSWRATMTARLRAGRILNSNSEETMRINAEATREVLLDIAATSALLDVDEMTEAVPPRNSTFLSSLFADESALPSQIFLATPPPRMTRSGQSMAQIKATRVRLLEGRCRLPDFRSTAKARIYSLTNYTIRNQWGPFQDESGTVNWMMLEAIVADMRASIEESFPDWNEVEVEGENVPVMPTGFAALLPWPARPLADPLKGDWAGVERWPLVGTYTFLDFREFHAFNFHRATGERPTLDQAEGTGDIMLMRLSLVDGPPSKSMDSRHIASSGRKKTLYFRGSSSSLAAMGDTAVSGAVLETPDGQIRWRMMISCAIRWALEGVQLGSSGAIAGTWSDASRDEVGPVGPFLYWRGRPYSDSM